MKGLIKIMFLLLMVFFTNSCRKKLRGGCKVKVNSTNFDPTADYEDGSCIFTSIVYIYPDSVDEYPVDIYIDNIFHTRFTKYRIGEYGRILGYELSYPLYELHKYRVEDDYGKVWEDTFSLQHQLREGKTILLTR